MSVKSSVLSLAALLAAGTALMSPLSAVPVRADEVLPQPYPAAAPIPEPQDVAYPGTIRLQVDATDTERRIFWVKESVPVKGPGPMTLLYPKWLPGNHSPTGAIDKLAGLIIHAKGGAADGQRVEWERDPVEVYGFHVDVPKGATALEMEFQFVSPTADNQGRIVITPDMTNVQWNAVALYPAGYFTRRIPVEASVKLPEGWGFGTALDVAKEAGKDGVTTFKTVPFETLVDSPMFAGRYYRRLDLDPGGRSPMHLNIVADRPELLEATPDQIAFHRNLVVQADKLFGARHYDHYEMLLALSDKLGHIGLEHHRSSENGTTPTYFTDWNKSAGHELLSHEYTHSWNGKYRRPADLWTPNFNVPMRDSGLWVYEGQTQFWGWVLAARAGLTTRQQALDNLAGVAATLETRAGRAWRDLADTTNGPIVAMRRPAPWISWQRAEDYYIEGQLIWLDADSLIRERSGGKRSLDDFAKAFFGINDGSYVPATYTFDDVVKTLNQVEPYDWATFLRTRLDTHQSAPMDGLARGGYKLVYTDQPLSEASRANEAPGSLNLTYSLGLALDKAGMLTSVQWNGPAFKTGLTVGTSVVAVNGVAYDADRMKAAVTAAKGQGPAVELIVKNGDRYRIVRIDYHDGLRYPHLERVEGTPARLDDLLTPRS
ncbi:MULTISPECIES: M61 family metallopeptidase [Nitrospirillum]|uniref:Putative metalloprotease with PDZ domain n=1 Tax=Nitrospirillum amazonense TaxID=28077 RepID=A0A560FXD0_9PROT|nr:M61 family metallopeptidase [Nitrospirillum amazonense]MEC4590414.1 M61 family metallopeptidase [Nitrospirillum amazonense]TWB26295.1 putative metalloprotease with PDZ domain [Nitrospirillum amazonense]